MLFAIQLAFLQAPSPFLPSMEDPVALAWVDLEGDGAHELVTLGAEGSVRLLVENGGRFEDASERLGLARITDAGLLRWADYDGDGQLDLFVGARTGASRLFHNDGELFTDMSAGSGLECTGAVLSADWLDRDGDGRLDLFVTTVEGERSSVRLFRGLEGGFFEALELPEWLESASVLAFGGELEQGVVPADAAAPGDGQPASLTGAASRPATPAANVPRRATLPGRTAPLAVPLIVGSHCTNSVRDQANPSACLEATSVPTTGKLFPGPHLGGFGNVQSGGNSFVGGGLNNTASGGEAVVGGGDLNSATNTRAAVCGGHLNSASGYTSFVGGGRGNDATGLDSAIPGGLDNLAAGDSSFAAGHNAEANHLGSFVWGDSQSTVKSSSAADQFNVYAEGGARVFAVGTTTPSLSVASGGNVGLSTSTALAKLDILGGADGGGANDPVALAFEHRTGGFRHFVRTRHDSAPGSSGNAMDFFLNDSVAAGTSSAPGVGNVGVVTLNATIPHRMQVAGGILVDANETSTGTTAGAMLRFGNTFSGEGILSKRTAGGNQWGLELMTAGQTRLAVTNAGNVGIGTTTPDSTLHVHKGSAGAVTANPNSPIVAENSTNSYVTILSPDASERGVIFGEPSNNSAGSILYNSPSVQDGLDLRTNGGVTRMVVSGTGNVGIGTSAPASLLEVNGSAAKPGGGSWSASSDARLKKNVRDLEHALETLLALRGVTFEYKDPAAIHELSGERIGFIAQEVEEVLPDWVEEGLNGYKRLTVRGFEALAVEALRELEQRNEALAERNSALEQRVAELESLAGELASLKASLQILLENR